MTDDYIFTNQALAWNEKKSQKESTIRILAASGFDVPAVDVRLLLSYLDKCREEYKDLLSSYSRSLVTRVNRSIF